MKPLRLALLTNTAPPPPMPELRLMSAVLQDALNCALGTCGDALEQQAARAWFMAQDWYLFSFRNICETMRLDPDGFLRKIAEPKGPRPARAMRLHGQHNRRLSVIAVGILVLLISLSRVASAAGTPTDTPTDTPTPDPGCCSCTSCPPDNHVVCIDNVADAPTCFTFCNNQGCDGGFTAGQNNCALVLVCGGGTSTPTATPTSTPTNTPTASPTVTPTITPANRIDISVDPTIQTVNTGDAVNILITAATNGLTTCGGAVFLAFDNSILTFDGGANNTVLWGTSTDSEPHLGMAPNIIALSVGSRPVPPAPTPTGTFIVATLNFTAVANGVSGFALLFDGMQNTLFYDCSLNPLTTFRYNGEVIVGGTPTPTVTLTPVATNTPTQTPTPLPGCCDCGEDSQCAQPVNDVCPDGCTLVLNASCGFVAPPGEPCTCQGDADKNGFVNSEDFASVAAHFGGTADPLTGLGDANCDGFVNSADFDAVNEHFGQACAPTPTVTP